jgi:hypothetical protein
LKGTSFEGFVDPGGDPIGKKEEKLSGKKKVVGDVDDRNTGML